MFGWISAVRIDVRAAAVCVFFAQHLLKKCFQSLWEARFFIAWGGRSVNVTERRRGGIPLLC
jgi:hypothetical protein